MVKMWLWKVCFILFEVFWKTYATTHWVVTETGRIQSYLDSPFHLRRPYDLIALLDQETRRNDINTLYKDLVNRRNVIDQKWSSLEGASDLEARIYSHDSDCLKSNKLLSEIDLYTSIGSNGSSRLGVIWDIEDETRSSYFMPDCTKFSRLHYSMFTFEHLTAMREKESANFSPETNLDYLMPHPSVDISGHEITLGLAENTSSWVHYNLAMLFWRIKGNALKAIECGRRALVNVPRNFKDIPLLNLAMVFHQSKYPKDAAILLHAAIEHSPYQPANYLALGNVYAVLSDYNRSVACYDNVLKLQPGLDDVIMAKYAMLCHRKLDSGLIDLHESLQGVLSDLHEYHSQQQQWLRLQERLMWEQAPFEAQLVGYTSEKLSHLLANRGQRCVQRISSDNSKPTITCDFTDHQTVTNLHVDVTLNLQRLLRNVESETKKISEQMARNKRNPNVSPVKEKETKENEPTVITADDLIGDSSKMPDVAHPIYPTTLSTSSNVYFDATSWPGREECIQWNLPLNEPDDLDVPVFLPPENKGFQVTKMLADYINLPPGSEHKLPWYPPVCEHPDKDVEKLYLPAPVRQLANVNSLKSHPLLRDHFLNYVNDGKAEESEIGQRIISAMHKKTGPGWVLATLASLYWRVRSNTKNALNCLDLAFQNVPKEHTDVILVSIGSMLHQLGLTDDAIKFAMLAFKVNYIEPSTNFLLGLLHYTKNNPLVAMYYMKNVLRVDPNYYDGKADELLRKWSCRIKLGSYEDIRMKADKVEGMCSDRDTFNGEGVICSANGEQCKTAAIQCFRADNANEDSGKSALNSKNKIISAEHCTKQKLGLGQSLISTLLASEGSGGVEPDQSQLESLIENPQQAFHMRISLGDDHITNGGNTLGDFYVSVLLSDDPIPEAMLHVYDKSGTYPLSAKGCRHIRDADWLHFTSMWQSIAARNVDIGPFLKSTHTTNVDLKPDCSEAVSTSSAALDHLLTTILRKKLPNSSENGLSEWLSLMAGDQEASAHELGSKIAVALKQNSTSWILATAAAIYWRVIGETEEAVKCLRQALAYVPDDMRDIPFVNLANVLHRVGLHNEALEVSYMALETHPDIAVNHFTVGNIHTSLGNLEKAISFYRSSLVLDASFEPARNRLQSILCTLLFDESGSLRESADFLEN